MWINCFPSELQLGDVWGEYGELLDKRQNTDSLTWQLFFRPPVDHLGAGRFEPEWPDLAPIRVFRAS